MQSVVNELNGFASACGVLVEVRDRILQLVTQADPALLHGEILTALMEEITPDTMYSRESMRGTHTIHRILRNLLSLLGIPYAQHPSTNRLAWALVAQFFEEEEDKEECYKRL